MKSDVGADVSRQTAGLYRLALGRPPRADEAARAADLVRQHGLESLAWVLFNANEFLSLR